jgi:hypothetical protein
MAITEKLRDLDQRILPGTRDPEESAEDYLRRVASGKVISPAQVGDVQAALQELFGITAQAEGETEPEPSPDQAEGERGDAPDTEPDPSDGGSGEQPEAAPDQAEGER